MNTITAHGETHEFDTPQELLDMPIVRKFTDDPAFTHMAHGDGWLLACRRVGDTPVWSAVGRLAKHVVLPKQIQGGAK